MRGLTMEYELGIPAILRRAEQLYGERPITSRLADGCWHTATTADVVQRARRLGLALQALGLSEGDRVATLMWNHQFHLETYVGAPAVGLVTHTLNPRLHVDHNVFIATRGGARVLVVDGSLWPVAQPIVERTQIEHVIVVDRGAAELPPGARDYEDVVATSPSSAFVDRDFDERSAAAMCFTSGTTGDPKGVVYSHRALALQALVVGPAIGLTPADTLLPVVPLFHANAWCLPLAALLCGTRQVLPGQHLDPQSLLEAFTSQRVTLSAGVPTIWLGLLRALDAQPDTWDLSAMRTMMVGGSAAPRSLIEGFATRHGLHVSHGWGMTELAPVGTFSGSPGHEIGFSESEAIDRRVLQGPPLAFVEIRARGDAGFVPWDGKTPGELEVRGPSVASGYYGANGPDDRWTDDGWFRTGDVAVIHDDGYVEIQDRTKDLVKSGGEWISSVALENALMGHPAVAEAAVIAVPDERWSERPLAVVVLRDGAAATPEELSTYLEAHVARFWIPERYEFVAEIPKTAVGKFLKTALRDRFSLAP